MCNGFTAIIADQTPHAFTACTFFWAVTNALELKASVNEERVIAPAVLFQVNQFRTASGGDRHKCELEFQQVGFMQRKLPGR